MTIYKLVEQDLIGIIIGTLSRVAGAWADRNGPRGPLAIGSVLVAVGTAGLAFSVTDFWLGVVAPVVLMSVGIALVVAPLTTAVMVAAPDTQSGAASGVNNAASRLAGLFAVAIIGALASVVFFSEIGAGNIAVADLRFGTLPDAGHTDRAVLEQAFIQAYGAAMSIAAAWGLLAALIALLFLRPAKRELGSGAGLGFKRWSVFHDDLAATVDEARSSKSSIGSEARGETKVPANPTRR